MTKKTQSNANKPPASSRTDGLMGWRGELSHADEKKFKQLQNSTERELLTVTLAGPISGF
jgi:hypothetical protein